MTHNGSVYEVLGILKSLTFNLLYRLFIFIKFNLTTYRPIPYIHYWLFVLFVFKKYWFTID